MGTCPSNDRADLQGFCGESVGLCVQGTEQTVNPGIWQDENDTLLQVLLRCDDAVIQYPSIFIIIFMNTVSSLHNRRFIFSQLPRPSNPLVYDRHLRCIHSGTTSNVASAETLLLHADSEETGELNAVLMLNLASSGATYNGF
jgi:hypothetical protein